MVYIRKKLLAAEREWTCGAIPEISRMKMKPGWDRPGRRGIEKTKNSGTSKTQRVWTILLWREKQRKVEQVVMTIQECYQKMGADYEDVLKRLYSESMIRKFARMFLDDDSYPILAHALKKENVEEAFRAAHTL